MCWSTVRWAGCPETEHAVLAMSARGLREVSPYWVPSMISNMPACEVAIDFGAHGPVSASALACASGTYAVLEARRLILAGEADVVIAGGTDSGLTPTMLGGLAKMGPLSERNHEPEAASRPFDADRDGFVFGEGAVIMVVESAAHAAARGARSYGSVAGGALTSDAFHISAPEPSGVHAARAVAVALERADAQPHELDYICAHGTGTRANDAAETRAIRIALGADADHVPASSPKSMVGHLIGAAGALSVMVCLLAMRDGILFPRPPTSRPPIPSATSTTSPCTPARPRSASRPPTRSGSEARTAWSCSERPDPRLRPDVTPQRPPRRQSARRSAGAWPSAWRSSAVA